MQVVFTIHNLEFGQSYIGEAAYYCQRFTTVSPTYAMEVGYCGCAPLAHLLQSHLTHDDRRVCRLDVSARRNCAGCRWRAIPRWRPR